MVRKCRTYGAQGNYEYINRVQTWSGGLGGGGGGSSSISSSSSSSRRRRRERKKEKIEAKRGHTKNKQGGERNAGEMGTAKKQCVSKLDDLAHYYTKTCWV
jgi:hypothetical protein